MRDPKRIKRITKKLELLWNYIPDQRLGQLMENYIFGAHYERGGQCIFYAEDDDTEAIIDARIAQFEGVAIKKISPKLKVTIIPVKTRKHTRR